MLEHLHLMNVGPAPEMRLELAPRLNLLTGDNGLGKTFLLDIAWWALTRHWPAEVNPALVSGLMARPRDAHEATIGFRFGGRASAKTYESTFDRAKQAWTGKAGRPANPGLVLYAQVDGSFALWDPARNYWQKKGGVDIQDRPPAYVFDAREVWNGLKVGDKVLCNGLLADWTSWQKEHGGGFGLLAKVLRALSPGGAEVLEPGKSFARLSLDDVRDIPTLKMPYGQEVPVLHASAGIRRILALAYFLVWSWQEHWRASALLGQASATQVIFLVDEIEAHLHPKWQRRIIRSLLQVVKALGTDVNAEVQLLAVTHSPLVLASVEPLFDAERDAWFDLDLVSSEVELKRREFVRRGDAASWLTSEAFDLEEARSAEAEEALVEAREVLRGRPPFDRDRLRKVDRKLRKTLSEVDRFWVRWSAFYEEATGASR
jgi:AAA domain, putative AbiEii toxin, Type IV TA system